MSYAGDISCAECWKVLSDTADAQLVDVRTTAEWSYVGLADLRGLNRRALLVEWQEFPTMQVNAAFADHVAAQLMALGITGKDVPLFTLCRSGVRSIAAAETLTRAGYGNVMNVLNGFEGGPNEDGHRGTISGWKVEGLPWRQN